MGKEPKTSYDIIADAVRIFWKELGYTTDVVAFFKQKYDFDSEDEWEECEELCSPYSSDNYTTVCFECDFCEGETDVKDIRIVSLQTIIDFYIDGSKPSTESKTVRMIDQSEAYEAMKHEAEMHELPASREAYERAARIIDQMKPVEAKQAQQKKGKWLEVSMEVGKFHGDVNGKCELSIVSGKCSECERYSYSLMQYAPQMPPFCSKCGAIMKLGDAK